MSSTPPDPRPQQVQQNPMQGKSNHQMTPPQSDSEAPMSPKHGPSTTSQAGGTSSPPSRQFVRPTLQQMNASMQFIRLAEEEYSNKRRTFSLVQISEHEKSSYMSQFDQLWRLVQEVEKKLIMYHALFGDEPSTTKLVTIIVTTKEQRKLLATPTAPPQYILGSQIVRQLLIELHNMMDRFYKAVMTLATDPSSTQSQTGTPPKAPGSHSLDPGSVVMDGQANSGALPQS